MPPAPIVSVCHCGTHDINSSFFTPSSITKPIRDRLSPESNAVTAKEQAQIQLREYLVGLNPAELLPQERKKLVFSLRKEMRQAASDLNFELAIELRDKVAEVKKI